MQQKANDLNLNFDKYVGKSIAIKVAVLQKKTFQTPRT